VIDPWPVRAADEPAVPGPGDANAAGRRRGSAGAAGALTVIALVLLGGPVGLLWATLSPRVAVVTGADGPQLVVPESKAFVAADGLFLVVAAVAGICCGLVVWTLARRHGVTVVLALAVGGVLASLVAWKTGRLLGLHDYRAALKAASPGRTLTMNVELRATGVLVGWSVAGVATFAGCLGVSLARHPEPAPVPGQERA